MLKATVATPWTKKSEMEQCKTKRAAEPIQPKNERKTFLSKPEPREYKGEGSQLYVPQNILQQNYAGKSNRSQQRGDGAIQKQRVKPEMLMAKICCGATRK